MGRVAKPANPSQDFWQYFSHLAERNRRQTKAATTLNFGSKNCRQSISLQYWYRNLLLIILHKRYYTYYRYVCCSVFDLNVHKINNKYRDSHKRRCAQYVSLLNRPFLEKTSSVKIMFKNKLLLFSRYHNYLNVVFCMYIRI